MKLPVTLILQVNGLDQIEAAINRLEGQVATLDQDVQDLIAAVQANAQATSDAAARVAGDLAALKAQIAAGLTPDPALLASIEAQTAAIKANTDIVVAMDPTNPVPPPPPEPPPAPPA